MKASALFLVAATGLQLAAAQFTSNGKGASTSGPIGSSNGAGSSSARDSAKAVDRAPDASGVGDPIFTGFDGRTFEFFGKVGSTYSLLSERNHQLSTRLKEAHMWDHNGTYMEAFSLLYRKHSIEVALADGDNLAVSVDGQPMRMLPSEVEVEHIFGMAEGELQLLWQLHRASYGNAVEFSSELLQVLVWVTPAGTRDEGGVEQPAYLNFDLKLLGAPAGGQMEGIIGHTYVGASSEAPKEANDWEFHHEAAEYEMGSFADASHEHNLYQQATSGARRLLGVTLPLRASVTGLKARAGAVSSQAVSFPLVAAGRGAQRETAAKPAAKPSHVTLVRA